MLKRKDYHFCIFIIIFQLMSCNTLTKGDEIAVQDSEVSSNGTAGSSEGTTTKQDANKTSTTQGVSSSTPSASTPSLPSTTNTSDSNSVPKSPRTPVNNSSLVTGASESNISVSENGTDSKTTDAKSTESTTEAQTGGDGNGAVTNKTGTSDSNDKATTPVPAPPSNTLSIFFVNDLRYDLFPVHSDNGSVCDAHDNVRCVGGVGRLKSYTQSKMKNNPNSLFLNAGNTLGGQWFKFLKYGTALEAIKFLNFSAMTVGPEVFEYGKEAGEDFLQKLNSTVVVSNINSSNVMKSKIYSIDMCNVSVIGFMDDNSTYFQENGVTVTNITEAIAQQINETRSKQNSSSHVITIALGSTTKEKAKLIANTTHGIDIILYSGNCTPAEIGEKDNTTNCSCWDHVNKTDNSSTYIYSLGMNHSDMAARFLLGELQITLGNSCNIANVDCSRYNYFDETDDPWTSNLTQLSGIADLDDKLTENMKNLSGETQSCSHAECSLGDLIADCMVAALGHNMWSTGAARLAVFPAAMLQYNTTLPKGNITAKQLYSLVPNDAYLYTVALTGHQLSEMLRVSLNSRHQANSTDFLHLSSLLHVKYNKTVSNTSNVISVDTVLDTSDTMTLQAMDINNNGTLYNVTVPYTLFHMESYKNLLGDINATRIVYHNVTVVEAVIRLIKNTGFLTLPVVGDRQQEIEPIVVKPVPDCPSSKGTTILVTLVVTAVVLGACYGIWWYIFKRRRGRSSSTMAMMNLDYGTS